MAAGTFRMCWSRSEEHSDESTGCFLCWGFLHCLQWLQGLPWEQMQELQPQGSLAKQSSGAGGTHRHFLWGTSQGKLLRATLTGQESSSANRGLQTSPDLMFLVVSKLRQVRKFKW